MTDTSRISGGAQNRASAIATADQSSIVGDGTAENPLRAGPPVVGLATTYQIHGSAFQASKSLTDWEYSQGNGTIGGIDVEGATGSDATCPLVFPLGTQIREIRVYVVDTTGSPPTKVQASLRTLTKLAVPGTPSASQVSDGTGNQQQLTIPDAGVTVGAGVGYAIRVATTQEPVSGSIWSCHLAEVDVVLPFVATT